MLSAVSAQHVLFSRLEEELLTARELEAAGEERLDAQQPKTSKNAHHQLSVRLARYHAHYA